VYCGRGSVVDITPLLFMHPIPLYLLIVLFTDGSGSGAGGEGLGSRADEEGSTHNTKYQGENRGNNEQSSAFYTHPVTLSARE
jgi:hypothetical protein